MSNQFIENGHARLWQVFTLLVAGLFISSCTASTSSTPPQPSTGIVVPGGGNEIILRSFWFNVEGDGVAPADRTIQLKDPIGGWLLLYWVDDRGNVCHGEPGVSGQPGFYEVPAYKKAAWNLSDKGVSITTTQLDDFQRFTYDLTRYTDQGKVSGLHFAQYTNVLWRARNDGSTSTERHAPYFSVPLVISVSTTNTLFPYFTHTWKACSGINLAVPLPSFPNGGPAQDPNRCLTRDYPASDTMNYQDSLDYCLSNLQKGSNGTP